MTWRWLDERLVLAIHDAQIAEHGGVPGVRDLGLLSSALAPPQHLAAYGAPDAFDLAAGYAHGIARNHPFADGNKRTAFVAAATFLYEHGHDIEADDARMLQAVLELSAGGMSERDFSAWLRSACVPAGDGRGAEGAVDPDG
jgi:death-on-curing protein